MAKFAKVGYGSDGRGLGRSEDGYTYVVNDNVRTGDRLQPIATNWKSGKKFVTTGVALHAYKETSKKGVDAKQQAQQDGTSDLTKIYSGKELGVTGFKGSKEYEMKTRAAAVGEYKQKDPNAEFTKRSEETFDSYSKKFMK